MRPASKWLTSLPTCVEASRRATTQAGDANLTVADANSVWVAARYALQPAYSQAGPNPSFAL